MYIINLLCASLNCIFFKLFSLKACLYNTQMLYLRIYLADIHHENSQNKALSDATKARDKESAGQGQRGSAQINF